MPDNPYTPPRANPVHRQSVKPVRLVDPHLIVAHTVVMVPAAGALLAALNYHRLRDDLAFWRTVLLFFVPGVILVWLPTTSYGPTNEGLRWLLFLGARVAMAWILYREHRPIVQKHIEAGGQRARWYLVMPAVLFLYLFSLAVWQFFTPANRPPH
ncbi:hypothetical protein LZC95_41860 [Pendulispora brunnea]|uniref:Uncharacterized protein n=1 Tax=Pendulispora brunnea TaxID=2905690 RepID=A0ABZ2K2P5_9BACT